MAFGRYLVTRFEGPVGRSLIERARAWLEVKIIASGRPALKAVDAQAAWGMGKPDAIVFATGYTAVVKSNRILGGDYRNPVRRRASSQLYRRKLAAIAASRCRPGYHPLILM
ncbi:hypothetical protein LJR235_004522 [Pararhizobium sp. LjRoot235]|uniref:hypothetical protein n=1 Tax=Pararhizobium sp. LjRoot235 TaxID=3342291 RepID=UPI003ECE219C